MTFMRPGLTITLTPAPFVSDATGAADAPWSRGAVEAVSG